MPPPQNTESQKMQSLKIKHLHHVALVTKHLEESIAFYREVLGFGDLRRPPFNFPGAWLYNYDVQIHIIENSGLAGQRNDNIHSRTDHIAFAVDDVELVLETLNAHGIQYSDRVNAGGVRQIFFQDPDGHHIEIALYGDASIGYEGP